MARTQPLRDDERLYKKLGLKEPTEEERELGKKVVSVTVVDDMFEDLLSRPRKRRSFVSKLTSPYHRFKKRIKDTRHMLRNLWRWRGLFKEYYPWDIHCFLPMFVKHLELYIELEKKHGMSTEEWIEHKTSTAQEALDIINRIMEDDYNRQYLDAVDEKWGNFPYERTKYANGSTGYKQLCPKEYEDARSEAYEQGQADEDRDLKRLGELIEKYMLDWWD
jgi:hypothetical protein